MKDVLEKISSYNLFNYLFPGVVYVLVLKMLTPINLVLENNFIGAFLYYFIGLVISRIGSLIIQPLLENFKVVKLSDYGDYVEASRGDDLIVLFSEVNNTYRTLISLSFVLMISVAYNEFIMPLNIGVIWLGFGISFLLLVLFVLSYRKQTEYINKRIEKFRAK